MSGPYIDGSTLEDVREALRQGQSIENLAGRLRCDVGHLSMLLGIRTGQPVLKEEPDQVTDLWAVDRVANRL